MAIEFRMQMDIGNPQAERENHSVVGASDVVGLPLFEEGVDSESKVGQGADGVGQLPTSIWQTYGAMANTDGERSTLALGDDAPEPISGVG